MTERGGGVESTFVGEEESSHLRGGREGGKGTVFVLVFCQIIFNF